MIVYQFYLLALFLVICVLNSKLKSNAVFIGNIVIGVTMTCYNIIGLGSHGQSSYHGLINTIVDVLYIIQALLMIVILIKRHKKNKVDTELENN